MILMFKIEYKLNCMMWNMFVVVSFDYSESLFQELWKNCCLILEFCF